jgi:hypothetical protein
MSEAGVAGERQRLRIAAMTYRVRRPPQRVQIYGPSPSGGRNADCRVLFRILNAVALFSGAATGPHQRSLGILRGCGRFSGIL